MTMGELVKLPDTPAVEFSPRGDRLRFVFKAVEGHAPAHQKKLVLDARGIGLLTNADTTLMLDALGLVEA